VRLIISVVEILLFKFRLSESIYNDGQYIPVKTCFLFIEMMVDLVTIFIKNPQLSTLLVIHCYIILNYVKI